MFRAACHSLYRFCHRQERSSSVGTAPGLSDSFARIRGGEIFLYGCEISPYENAGYSRHDPTRARKLLLHSREIARLAGKVSQKGLTIVPLRMYFKRGWVKVLLALARGKEQYDKREAIKKREQRREIRRALGKRG